MFRLEDYLFYNQDYCFLCKEEKALKLICKNCYDSLELINGEFNLDNGKCYYPLFYNNFIKRLISDYKFSKKTYLSKPFALLMYNLIKDRKLASKIDYITYIPMDSLSEYRRGFNQAQLLAQELSTLLDIPLLDILYKNRRTKEQNKISFDQRKTNLEASFSLLKDCNISNKIVLLIDDLITTGTTMEEAIKTIELLDGLEVIGLVLASSRIEEEV